MLLVVEEECSTKAAVEVVHPIPEEGEEAARQASWLMDSGLDAARW